jgi:hypothetical protein
MVPPSPTCSVPASQPNNAPLRHDPFSVPPLKGRKRAGPVVLDLTSFGLGAAGFFQPLHLLEYHTARVMATARKVMLRKRLTRSLVRNLALDEVLLTSMVVVELVLLSCDMGMVARW